jgi:MOSC domain-containing protein YiiM
VAHIESVNVGVPNHTGVKSGISGIDKHPSPDAENLTTVGLDVTGAVTGERWRVGDELVLQVTCPRIPCVTFEEQMGEAGWIKRFTKAAAPGAYLRVLRPGPVRAGDRVVVEGRPESPATIGLSFRALTLEPELLATIVDAPDLVPEIRERARRRLPAG